MRFEPLESLKAIKTKLLTLPWQKQVRTLVYCVAGTLALPHNAIAADINFNEQIKPLLVENCLHCHGPDEQRREADLRLDLEKDATANAITPGDPDNSLFIQRIESDDPSERMPPPDSGKQLTESQIALLRQWIEAGAPFQEHWAFKPIDKPELPTTKRETTSDIDRFIVARLEAKSLELAPKISQQQFIRRATFDLIGLPPTWEETQAFVNDQSPDAYDKLIDRLLESPHYGERWGRHWLDLARYADTHGGSAIGFVKFPFSYTYRDYVIHAFNADVPYDRFVTEQIAADQLGLPNNDPAFAGLGFLTVGMQFRNPHDIIDDQIDVVTRGLMGLTVACARCHDHKYDPVPTTDYYALYATFASSNKPETLPIIGTQPNTDAYKLYEKELERRETIYRDMARDQSEVMRNRLRMQVGIYLRELAKGTPEQDLSAAFLSYRTDDIRPLVLNRWRDYLSTMPESDPVFGPWVVLARLEPENFATECASLVEQWKQQNGDPANFANLQSLAKAAPKWNPRVLDALSTQNPANLLDVADAYGVLFADAQRQWLTSLLDASMEAALGAEIYSDEDPRHEAINSAVNNQLRRHLHEPGTPTAMPDDLAVTLLNRTVRDNLGGKGGAIHNLHLDSPGSPPRAMTLQESTDKQEFHVFRRGNPLDRGERVQPRFLTVFTASDKVPTPFPEKHYRLELAKRLVAPDNPLLRRVLVNWVWQHHFGRGLVTTPDDFGARSQPPSHPLLLDYLATRFLDEGWSLKKLHKQIMLSDTYQQASIEKSAYREIDPDNQLLWRMPRKRLDMEAMRDSLLAVSGELNISSIGGRPFEFLSNPVVPRRSIYGFVNRDIISSLASTFDGANAASCTAKRSETTVPQQTLFALNSSFIQDRAAAFSKRSEAIENHEQRIVFLFHEAYGRDPNDQELQASLRFIQEDQSDNPVEAWQQLAHVLLAANEFIFVD